MITMGIKQFQGTFFDRAKVQNAADRAAVRNLSRAGAFVRTRARSLLRYRDKPSAEGKPPSIHKTMVREKKVRSGLNAGDYSKQAVSPLREFLFFGYDSSTRSEVVGPAKINQTGSDTVLSALEYGGTSRVIRGRKRREKRWVMATIKAHPTMQPALAAEVPRLAPLWANSIAA